MTGSELQGDYRGHGAWHQADGTRGGYAVTLSLARAGKALRLVYTHVFDNGDPDTVAHFDLVPEGPVLCTVLADGQAVGRGYLLAGLVHYTLEMPGNVVEGTLLADGTGLRVIGSASRNRAGQAIAWDERLERV